jgi:hypothetical protein
LTRMDQDEVKRDARVGMLPFTAPPKASSTVEYYRDRATKLKYKYTSVQARELRNVVYAIGKAHDNIDQAQYDCAGYGRNDMDKAETRQVLEGKAAAEKTVNDIIIENGQLLPKIEVLLNQADELFKEYTRKLQSQRRGLCFNAPCACGKEASDDSDQVDYSSNSEDSVVASVESQTGLPRKRFRPSI